MTTMGYVITVDLIRDVTPIGNRVHQEIGNSIVKLNGSKIHGCSSEARALVSKTRGRDFEILHPCKN